MSGLDDGPCHPEERRLTRYLVRLLRTTRPEWIEWRYSALSWLVCLVELPTELYFMRESYFMVMLWLLRTFAARVA